MVSLDSIRGELRAETLRDEDALVRELIDEAALSPADRSAIAGHAAGLVEDIRRSRAGGLMETLLAEYGLSTHEGVALMCLAEAFLRVPDTETLDALIEDKIAPSDWGLHLGKSSSSMVNASTWALLLTGKVLDAERPGVAGVLRETVKRLGEPVIRSAVARAIQQMGRQFVLGRDIEEAMRRAERREALGLTFSYDMLGEAALTEADAGRYLGAYLSAIAAIAARCVGNDCRRNPGISVKLSALFPRYERIQRARVLQTLVPRLRDLALAAKSAGMGMNIDAEEADRLDLSLDVIEAVLADRALSGWDGFGVVVQAYGKRTGRVVDWLYALARSHDRRIMIRLVKGAYWDTEIKLAQVLGIRDYPVFTRKSFTDISYLAAARKLLAMRDRIYPQFASHNAHTVAAILRMAPEASGFEFQRLHGMGEVLHDILRDRNGTTCRIYAPVGAHRDLLAYLVRRLLENGANSSFVNQIVNRFLAPEKVAADPIAAAENLLDAAPRIRPVPRPPDLFGQERSNSSGVNLNDPVDAGAFDQARSPFRSATWHAEPLLAGPVAGGARSAVKNPAEPSDRPGTVTEASPSDVETALASARPWSESAMMRASVLMKAAGLFEDHAGELFAIAAREAGRTAIDAVAELREAVDFLRYYAVQVPHLEHPAQGVFGCISPWNFPLAIFTGQIAAALAAGNAVLAKPAEATPLIAARAVDLLLRAGVPASALQLLPGTGARVGTALCSDPRIDGICFTGSIATARKINSAMARKLAPGAPLIAETGGINAMILDSTAMPEQAVRDILVSAFQSAGQRCSALRMLYVQEDVAQSILKMLFGAMDALVVGPPWELATDIGPIIDQPARRKILQHISAARQQGRLLHQIGAPARGHFVGPAVLRVGSIADLKEEIFGPVLHVASFTTDQLGRVVDDINGSGSALTFGLHTRVDSRVQHIVSRLRVGNCYVNRNQIGAIVGSQPFGGEGLSGTGPKAGGPSYLPRFTRHLTGAAAHVHADPITVDLLQAAIDAAGRPDAGAVLGQAEMQGVTGESNRLSIHPRGLVLCLGPGVSAARRQAREARAQGCTALEIAAGCRLDGTVPAGALRDLQGFDAVAFWGPADAQRAIRQALADRPGALIPLITETGYPGRYHIERHLCVNTTATGGNTQLLSQSEPAAGG
ncbi:MAG: bifunctional proline dehydrogenase/L-glutamate gamma-semialdehyde dehydrogenase PutA [Cucumibacter sp.]